MKIGVDVKMFFECKKRMFRQIQRHKQNARQIEDTIATQKRNERMKNEVTKIYIRMNHLYIPTPTRQCHLKLCLKTLQALDR